MAIVGALLMLLAHPALAPAAFPGLNGKIAFHSDRDGQVDEFGVPGLELYSMNPDGSSPTRLTEVAQSPDPLDVSPDHEPAWSADGARLVYSCGGTDAWALCLASADGANPQRFYRYRSPLGSGEYLALLDPTFSLGGTRVAFTELIESCDFFEWDPSECYIGSAVSAVDTDGTDHQYLKRPSYGATDVCCPSWSPRNDKIVYDWHPTFRTISPDGTSDMPHPLCCSHPNWSPDGTKLVYARDVGTGGTDNYEIFVANADGTGEVRLTNNGPVDDEEPAWSPDGQEIAFQSDEGGDYEIFVMNNDGSGRTQLTNNLAHDGAADWQPLSFSGYPRPVKAAAVVTSLVPAYAACTAPNRWHGPPLEQSSCSSPAQLSQHLTVGTFDANGRLPTSMGQVRYDALTGDPANPPDEADLRFTVTLTDVRRAADLSDYEGELELRAGLRITDRGGTVAADDPATVQDFDFAVTVPCAATADQSTGARCDVIATADGILPGAITERNRTIWALDRTRVDDGGPDGVADTQDNTPFMVQGLFVP